jgi:hypothetical protein
MKFWVENALTIPKMMAKVTAVEARIIHARFAKNHSLTDSLASLRIIFVPIQRTIIWFRMMAIIP